MTPTRTEPTRQTTRRRPTGQSVTIQSIDPKGSNLEPIARVAERKGRVEETWATRDVRSQCSLSSVRCYVDLLLSVGRGIAIGTELFLCRLGDVDLSSRD